LRRRKTAAALKDKEVVMGRFILGMALLFLGLDTAFGQSNGPPASLESTLRETRQQAWRTAGVVVSALDLSDARSFPGIRAFVEDYRSVEQLIRGRATADKWPTIDADVMVTKNPNFWRACYEIAPADPGVLHLHAALLLSGGEANRAAQIVMLARQRPGIPKELRNDQETLLNRALAVVQEGDRDVQAGIKLHDAGDLPAAMRKYRDSLARWPQNSWAEYELGYTLRTRGQSPNPVVLTSNMSTPGQAAEVLEHWMGSRRHDPLRWEAYQGSDPESSAVLGALKRRVLPAWDKIKAGSRVEDDVLLQFADGCQQAGIHDLALVARQIVIARRGRYAPADHPFISTSLRKLAPGEKAEIVLKRLAGEKLQLRQLVKPESSAP
jgi:tetratricopeptide (TPR) repeat protein